MADLMNLTYRRAEPGDVDACVVRHPLTIVSPHATEFHDFWHFSQKNRLLALVPIA